MRTSMFLLFAILLSAQEQHPLQKFLKATPDQWELLTTNYSNFYQLQVEDAGKLSTLNRQISVETLKAAPNEAELGAKYLEIEDLCRSLVAPKVELHRKQLSVLTDEQRAMLGALNAALSGSQTLYLVEYFAQDLKLKVPQTGGFSFPSPPNGTPFESPSYLLDPEYTRQPGVPDELIRYLSLSMAQRERIENLNAEYKNYFDPTFERMRAMGLLVETELARNTPNAQAVGGHYAQIEGHRRMLATRGAALRRDLSEVLTPSQQDQLKELDVALERQYLAAQAAAILLLPPFEGPRPLSQAMFPANPLVRTLSAGEPLPGAQTASYIFRGCTGGPEVFFSFDFDGSTNNRALHRLR